MAMQRCCQQPWIILLCCVILGGTRVYSNIVIEQPQDVIGYQDEPLTWDCHAEAAPNSGPYDIVWIFRRDVINATSDAHKFVLANGSLYIDGVEGERDGGPYRCCGKNETGILCSQEALLQIAELPHFVEELEPTVAYQGGVARFECKVSGVPKANITWKHIASASGVERSNVRITPISQRHVILPNGVLQIHNVSFADEGRYKCIASNSLQTMRNNSATLTVLPRAMAQTPLSEPYIVRAPAHQSVVAGDDALLECLVEGVPLQVTWGRKDGRAIRRDGVSYPGGSNLLIRSVRPKVDNATYRCYATNPETGRTILAEAKLEVMTAPVITVAPHVIRRVIGATVRFWCLAVGQPTPTMSWLHNGLPATQDDYHEQMANNDYVISQLWWEDEGVYQCEARNPAGTAIVSGGVTIDRLDSYPGPVRNLSLFVLTSHTVNVTWEDPSNLPDPVIAYSVESKPLIEDGKPLEELIVGQKHFKLVNLMAYTQYRVTVQCYTSRAPCPRQVEFVMMDEDVPSTWPEFSLASETPTTITVTWNTLPPRSANGIIVSYAIAYCHGDCTTYNETEVDGALLEFTLTGLQADTNYSVSMAAGTSVGYSRYSDPFVVATPKGFNETTPKPPQHLQVSHLNHTALRVTFQPGALPPATLGFKLLVTKEGEGVAAPIVLPANATEYVITGLEPNTQYNVRVLGYNSNGEGRSSTQTTKTPTKPITMSPEDYLPPPFEINATSHTPTQLLLQWERPLTDKIIIGFVIEYSLVGGNITTRLETDGSTYEVLLIDLEPFTEYIYQIQSVGTFVQPGPFSRPARAHTLEGKPSDPPSDVQASPVNSNTVEVRWQPPARPNGIITRYTVMYQRDPSLPEESWECEQKDGSMHQSTIESLSSNTKYYFKVRAGTQAGDGPPTDAVAAQTLPGSQIPEDNSKETLQQGILIGVCLSLVCICVCTALVTYRLRHVCFRPRTEHQCSCSLSAGSTPCVHYRANGGSQRVYMSVPSNEEITDTGLPVLTRYGNASQNGYGPSWHNHHAHTNGHAHPVMNGHGPPTGNGHGPPTGNGHGPPRMNGHGPPRGNGYGPHPHPPGNGHGPPRGNGAPPGGRLVGWQQPYPPLHHHPPLASGRGPGGLYGDGGLQQEEDEEEASHSGSSMHGSGLIHSQEHSRGTAHQGLHQDASTSQLQLSGTKSLTSLQSNVSSLSSAHSAANTRSSRDSLSRHHQHHHHHHLPPTEATQFASITPPSHGYCCCTSGVVSMGMGGIPPCSDGRGGGDPSPSTTTTTPISQVTGHPLPPLPSCSPSPGDAHLNLPPARCVDPQRVLTLQDHAPSQPSASTPTGVDSWDRWVPPSLSTTTSNPEEETDPSARDREAIHAATEPNRTLETCIV